MNPKLITWIVIIVIVGISIYHLWREGKKKKENGNE